MNIHIISVGTRPPAWVETGFQDYCQRIPKEFQLKLIEIPTPKRTRSANLARLVQQEGELILKAVPNYSHIVALNVKGTPLSTPQLAEKLGYWNQQAQNISLLVGGPDGLSEQCLTKAHEQWSLSNLTFPHALVRVILAEQIYRAWSILAHHPYHR